jgi:hypothetical protein
VEAGKQHGERRADFVIPSADKVLVIEAKSGHFVGLTHASFLRLDERRKELADKVGIEHGVKQLAETITALRAGQFAALDLPPYDWTCTPIVPVIVTEEPTPQVVGCWEHLYEPLCGSLDDLGQARGPIGRLRLLSVDEAETLPDLAANHDLATLLYRWGTRSQLDCELPWRCFLQASDIVGSGDFIRGRVHDLRDVLASRLGFDPAAIKALQASGPTES